MKQDRRSSSVEGNIFAEEADKDFEMLHSIVESLDVQRMFVML